MIRKESKEIINGGWWHIEIDFQPNNQYKVVNIVFDKNKIKILKEVTLSFSTLDDLKNNGHFTAK